jgi:hypothetical protein
MFFHVGAAFSAASEPASAAHAATVATVVSEEMRRTGGRLVGFYAVTASNMASTSTTTQMIAAIKVRGARELVYREFFPFFSCTWQA